MPHDRDRAYLRDILYAAKVTLSHASGLSEEDFRADIKTQDAVIRRLEIIGEAARRVSEPYRSAHPSIPWMEMRGMRDRMIHEYNHVDLSLIGNTIQQDLPQLVHILSTVMNQD